MTTLSTAAAILLGGAQYLDRVRGEDGHAPDPPRLPDEPGKPLQTRPPHPYRRARHAPGQVVERPAHADREGDAEPVLEPVDPDLLCRCAKGDEDHVRVVIVDAVQRLDVVRRVRRPGARVHLQAFV